MKHRYMVWVLQGRPDPWPQGLAWDDLQRWWLREPTPEQVAQAAIDIIAQVVNDSYSYFNPADGEWEWVMGEQSLTNEALRQHTAAGQTTTRIVRQADNDGFGWGVLAGLFLGGGG